MQRLKPHSLVLTTLANNKMRILAAAIQRPAGMGVRYIQLTYIVIASCTKLRVSVVTLHKDRPAEL